MTDTSDSENTSGFLTSKNKKKYHYEKFECENHVGLS